MGESNTNLQDASLSLWYTKRPTPREMGDTDHGAKMLMVGYGQQGSPKMKACPATGTMSMLAAENLALV